MKKLFTFVLVLAICVVCFASCNADKSNPAVSFENTTWKGSYKPNPNVTLSVTYTFTATSYNSTATDGSATQTDAGTYTFVFPNLKMKSSNSSNTFEANGTLNNDKLTVSTPSGMILTLSKQ